MIRILMLLLPFLKELVFGKMNDKSTTGIFYKFRGWVILITILFLVVMNTVIVDKLYRLSSMHIKITKQLAEQEDATDKLKVCKIELAAVSGFCLQPNKTTTRPK